MGKLFVVGLTVGVAIGAVAASVFQSAFDPAAPGATRSGDRGGTPRPGAGAVEARPRPTDPAPPGDRRRPLSPTGVTSQPRNAATILAALASARQGSDGVAILQLLAELAALGPEHLPRIAAEWARLIHLDAIALDALNLSRLDLAAALAQQSGTLRFCLAEADLDPDLRGFAARTLSEARPALRHSVLDAVDFHHEKDKGVLRHMIRALHGTRDEAYVDRFLHLVQRTDLYNDTRHSIGMMVAAIGGSESRRAIDVLRASGHYARTVPILETIHAPPITGLLVTNGLPPGPGRIGHSDVLVEYHGKPIRTRADLTAADSKTAPGDVVKARVFRNGRTIDLQITVTDTAPGHLHFSARPIVKRD